MSPSASDEDCFRHRRGHGRFHVDLNARSHWPLPGCPSPPWSGRTSCFFIPTTPFQCCSQGLLVPFGAGHHPLPPLFRCPPLRVRLPSNPQLPPPARLPPGGRCDTRLPPPPGWEPPLFGVIHPLRTMHPPLPPLPAPLPRRRRQRRPPLAAATVARHRNRWAWTTFSASPLLRAGRGSSRRRFLRPSPSKRAAPWTPTGRPSRATLGGCGDTSETAGPPRYRVRSQWGGMRPCFCLHVMLLFGLHFSAVRSFWMGGLTLIAWVYDVWLC